MLKKSSKSTHDKLEKILSTVGDMALKRRAKRIVEGLELKEGDIILDLGCGNGYYLSVLKRLGLKLKLFGVDNDKRALSDAKKILKDDNIKLVLANAEELPFKNKSFDKIIISEVVEHVSNERQVLKEVYRVLKPGGILTLTTCNIDYPFFWDPINWILQHPFKTHIKEGFWAGIWNQHKRMYKKQEVESLIKKAKFNLILSESLTTWCLPFNHYLVNFTARLFYAGKLPRKIASGINKFQNGRQSILVKMILFSVNILDKANDIISLDNGVSIFIKARVTN